MKPLLSILIPTTPDRMGDIMRLYKSVSNQCGITTLFLDENSHQIRRGYNLDKTIELIEFTDNRELTIGEKRERLYQLASGSFSIQIDSDDDIADNAIEKILEAIKSNPEVSCVTFRENCMMNGVYKSSNHSLKYFQWMDNQDGYDYVRSPFYKDVIRTDIAKSVPFPHIRWNEDEQWSKALYPHLKDEIHIDEELYLYIYNETNHTERYGLDK